jgi:hypothetical protein
MDSEFRKIVKAFKATEKPWAVTGSWAIKFHAEKENIAPHRTPRDFDFAVNGSDFETFIHALQMCGYKHGSGVPLITAKKVPSRIAMIKGDYEVDLLKAGGGLAPSLNRLDTYNNIPLVSVSNLVSQKKNIIENLPNTKAQANLNFLQTLAVSSSPKKSPSVKPRVNMAPRRLF